MDTRSTFLYSLLVRAYITAVCWGCACASIQRVLHLGIGRRPSTNLLEWTSAPADVKKEGPSFDLPIAVGILAVSEQIVTENLDDYTIVGELALSGEVRSVNGVLPIAICARDQKKRG